MPRYLVKFEDGTEQEMGFPGPHSEKIQKTAIATAEKNTGKKVASLQLSKTSSKKNKAKSTAKTKINNKTSYKDDSKSKKKIISGIQKGKVSTINDSSIQAQINSLESALTGVIGQLSLQINELKTSILLAKKQELLNQLNEIDSQL